MKKVHLITACFFFLSFFAFSHSFSTDNITVSDSYTIDTRQSSIKWTGKSVRGGHFGNISISSGSFKSDGKMINSGRVVVNMNSITVSDLEDPARKERLTNHLKNDDFFASDKFPEAVLEITSSKPGANGQLIVSGNLTIKGITQPVSFPATVKTKSGQIETEGTITVDRIKYDIKYRSKSILDPSALADRMIYDEFTLDFKVVAKNSAM